MPTYPASPHPAASRTSLDTPELDRSGWDRVAVALLAKMLGEFAYEEVIEPEPRTYDGAERTGTYTLTLDDGGTLSFHARRGVYGSWRVDPATIREVPAGDTHETAAGYEGKTPAGATAENPAGARAEGAGGERTPVGGTRAEGTGVGGTPFRDPLRFLARARGLLGLDGATLAHLIRELTATLIADTRLDRTALGAAQLAELPYAELEGHQTGHPWLVANKGRLGFSAADAARFTPEARSATTLPWIAVSSRIAEYRGVGGLAAPDDLYARELDQQVRESFAEILRGRGLDPGEYLFMPVHPWQWDEWIVPVFAPAIADGAVVPLHADEDLRLPQQSIRTFTNVGRPDRHTVKLPLSILNTLVWRGLPTERTLAAPAVTAWVQGLCDGDPFLRDTCRVVLLGEVASVTVEHPLYDRLPESPYQFKEILGAIWREPLQPRLVPGERARTLASLLLTDPDGRSFTAELVARSGLAPVAWLTRLLDALLPPLLHFLYRYGTVFSPHGENAIVIFDGDDVPVRLAIKDFVDDVNISARALPEHDAMPTGVRDILLTEEPAFLTQFIHSGLFVGVLRYLSPLCEEQLDVPEREFWSLVRAEILRYHARFPELKDRFEIFDMLTPTIKRLCLNRNRLHLDGYRDRPERPHAAVHGTVANPLHPSA
ncbi:IucA/IucC family siderophore biosynthesis protein [Streptomyces sp. NPDC006288]|uniref:IucA/IucC family protein n=1 Tax=Streptomyces sp. NPDC006288 TaxID=3156743 RepID=UPI0033A77C7D